VVEADFHDLEAEALRTPLFASDFSRYAFHPQGKWSVLFPYDAQNDFRLHDEAVIQEEAMAEGLLASEKQRGCLEAQEGLQAVVRFQRSA
jgi:hypothetical protein